jgi:endonuclease/exonuclease/phosphatase family metal-dependent hydrolase
MLKAALVAISLTACMHHGIPADRTVETHTSDIAAPQTTKLKVVTFNVQRQPGDIVADAIQKEPVLRDADVILLEEVHRVDLSLCSGACIVGKHLGYHVAYAAGHAQDDGTDGVAIVSRYPIRDTEVIELPAYDVHWNDGRRIALAAKIDFGDRPVSVYAVHLENRITVAQRRHQMLPVLAHAEKQTTPVIIGGDLNTSPFTWIGHAVPVLTNEQDDEMESLVRKHGFDTPVVDSGATSRYLGMKLDAIYTKGFATKYFSTAHAGNISDHIALWAQMQLAD